jgi:hypothetical protein
VTIFQSGKHEAIFAPAVHINNPANPVCMHAISATAANVSKSFSR